MAAAPRGGGPSRRSHTKSRKGCKTCKRRHIRCDESFPQCRNCTKHHVRCDYQDITAPEFDALNAERASPTPTRYSDDGYSIRSLSARSYSQPSPSYTDVGSSLFPADAENHFGADSHLILSLYAIADNLDTKGASDLTIWVSMMRRHLSIAPHYPYVMDALKAFSANQLAWASQSPAAREQSVQYSTTALSGLHVAVGQFSKSNADSVLATTNLLACQSRDYLSWSSLLRGITSVTAAIESWHQDSIYSDEVARINSQAAWKASGANLGDMSHARSEVLMRVHYALQQLRAQLGPRPVEAHWLDQLIDLIQRLQAVPPANTDDEQFAQLFMLRKWTYWLPVHLLQDGPIDLLKLSVIAHLYATALALSPVFPRLGSELCGDVSAPPLVNVLGRMESLQIEMGYIDPRPLMEFPNTVLAEFNVRSPWSTSTRARPSAHQIPDISTYLFEEPEVPGNLSPAFAPAAFEPHHTRASSSASNFLEVPTPQRHQGMSGLTNQWETHPSPTFAAQIFTSPEDDFLLAEDRTNMFSNPFGGYIQPCEIWT